MSSCIVETVKFTAFYLWRHWTGLVFVLHVNTILGFQNQASTRLKAQTFDIRLDGECRIGTPIRRYLKINETFVAQSIFDVQRVGQVKLLNQNTYLCLSSSLGTLQLSCLNMIRSIQEILKICFFAAHVFSFYLHLKYCICLVSTWWRES